MHLFTTASNGHISVSSSQFSLLISRNTELPKRMQFTLSSTSLPFSSIDVFDNLHRNSSISVTKPSTFSSSPTISLQSRDRSLVIRARKKRRRPVSQRSSKLILELASVMVSNLKILPQPLDWIIRELSSSGGGGGGFGWRKGFGGGGFDGWRRRRVNKNFNFILVLIISALILLFRTDLDINSGKLVLGFSLFGIALNQWLRKRGLLYLSIELCVWGAMVFLGLKRVELQQWSEKIRNGEPLMKIIRRRIIRGRGAF